MEMSRRYNDLQAAVLSVYIDRLFAHDDGDSLAAMDHAGTEFNLNYEGGDIQDRLGSASAAEVATLVGLARRLHFGEDTVAMQDDLRSFLKPLLDADIHC